MIEASALRKQALNKYPAVVEALLRSENPFPLRIRYSRIQNTATRESILRDIAVLRAESREVLGHGLTIEWQDVNTLKHGRNRLPGNVSLANEADFLGYVAKREEVESIRRAARILSTSFPDLVPALPTLWRLLRTGDGVYWGSVCRVLRYFHEHAFPNRFARELPIEVPTKFIEENRGVLEKLILFVAPQSIQAEGESFEERLGLKTPETLVECRLLDDALLPDWRFRQFTVGLGDLRHLDDVPATNFLITENRTNFLTLPTLPKTIALQGQGYAVSRLKRAPFLRNRRLLYWGDLDSQGFEILAVLRRDFPHVESLLMDESTWNQLSDHRQPGVRTRNAPELFLPHLRPDEIKLFETIRSMNQRLEQERIPHAHAMDILQRALA